MKDKMLYVTLKSVLSYSATMSFVGIHLSEYDEFGFVELKKEVLSKSVTV